MRKVIWLFLCTVGVCFSQNKQVLYGFSEIPQALLLNPGGKIENDWYFGIPLLSHIHTNIGLSGATVYDIFADDGVDFNTKLRNAVYGMNSKDFFSANEQLEIFSGGFAFGDRFKKDKYISFGMYQEFDFIFYFPKDYALLAYEGNRNNINRQFNAGHVSGAAEVISVLHVGYNKKVNTTFSFGVRGKIYSNIINLNTTKNKGYFVTVYGDNNFYNHLFNLDLELTTSGLASLTDDEAGPDKVAGALKRRMLFGGDLGLGVDLGFTYKLSDQWTLDGSLLDIGFIRHKKDVKNYSVAGYYAFEGANPIFPELGDGQTAEEYWEAIEGEFEELFTVDTTKTKFTTWRPLKLNASLNYAFGEKKSKTCNCIKEDEGFQNAIGLQLYAINRPKQPQMALTAYYYRELFEGLRAKATYTLDSYSFYNVGLGLSVHLGNVNFYLMADNFFQYKNIYNAQSVSLQLGINYIFNKK